MAIPESTFISSSIQTKHRNVYAYIYTYMHLTTTNEKWGHRFERAEYMQGFEGRKGIIL